METLYAPYIKGFIRQHTTTHKLTEATQRLVLQKSGFKVKKAQDCSKIQEIIPTKGENRLLDL